MTVDSPVWLITGCSSGFGIELARVALAANHRVVATSRNPSKTPELVKEVEEAGGKWFTLDVANPAAEVATDIVKQVLGAFGRIDVLVNNAGTCLTGICEFITDAQAKEQFEVNFFGAHRLMSAVLPTMRAQKSGTIVNISSMAGVSANPTLCMYAASKHALEALTESLSVEVKALGVRCLIVEPGNFRTNVLASAVSVSEQPIPESYKESDVVAAFARFKVNHGGQPGDTVLGCQRIFEAVMRTGMFENRPWDLRLPLGSDCLQRIQGKIDLLTKSITTQADIAKSTDS